MIHDERDPEDLDTTQEDHAADALRYFLISRSYPAHPKKEDAPEGSFSWHIQQETKRRQNIDAIV